MICKMVKWANDNYKITTITLPVDHLKFFKKMKELKYYPSVSEIIRQCIDIGMPQIISNIKEMAKLTKKEDLPSIFEHLKKNGFIIMTSKKLRKTNVPLGNITNNSDNKKDVNFPKKHKSKTYKK